MNICVVVPVYNSPFIEEVLTDLAQYDYKIVVVDDGSSPKVSIK